MTMSNGKLVRERVRLSVQLDRLLDVPIGILGIVWVALFIVEAAIGQRRELALASYVIWAIFIADFLLKLWIAPAKRHFLRSHWLSAVSLLVPALGAFRILRLARFARAVRGVRLVRYLTSVNRGLRALRRHLRRQRVAFVMLATVIVVFASAGAAYVLERDGGNMRIGRSYGDALWWAGMIVTTLGSEAWPETAEGRLLCFFLSAYTFAVFGFITATLASFFVGRDGKTGGTESLEIDERLKRIEARIDRVT